MPTQTFLDIVIGVELLGWIGLAKLDVRDRAQAIALAWGR